MEDVDRSESGSVPQPSRGAPLVATGVRWLVAAAGVALGTALVVETYVSLWRSAGSLASFAWPLAAVDVPRDPHDQAGQSKLVVRGSLIRR